MSIHKNCLDNPPKALKDAFELTTRSTQSAVVKVFLDCAGETGMIASIAESDAMAFLQTGAVPAFVLQCCSAKLAASDNA